MANIIVWADIPATDLERASKFYSHVLGMPVAQMPGMDGIALPGSGEMPADRPEIAPVAFDLYTNGKPSEDGCTVYLGSMGDVDGMVARVSEAGGEILQEKRFMGPMVGWIAFFRDSEGNRIGIQQMGEGTE